MSGCFREVYATAQSGGRRPAGDTQPRSAKGALDPDRSPGVSVNGRSKPKEWTFVGCVWAVVSRPEGSRELACCSAPR
jgi:hypothetical protein